MKCMEFKIENKTGNLTQFIGTRQLGKTYNLVKSIKNTILDLNENDKDVDILLVLPTVNSSYTNDFIAKFITCDFEELIDKVSIKKYSSNKENKSKEDKEIRVYTITTKEYVNDFIFNNNIQKDINPKYVFIDHEEFLIQEISNHLGYKKITTTISIDNIK